MDLELAGRGAVVTGASRGIGLATVRRLIAEGMRVVAGARTSPAELVETGATVVSTDLNTLDGAEELAGRAIAELGEIDLLVNNVGGGDHVQNLVFADTTDGEWHDILSLNLMAPVRVTRAALPSLKRSRGVVVTVSSQGALVPRRATLGEPICYPAAKAALNATMKALSVELGAEGVRVTTVTPGLTRTSLWEGEVSERFAAMAGISQEDFLAALPVQDGLVTQRWITPEEIATTIAFAASPLSASTVGANFLVDGGASRFL